MIYCYLKMYNCTSYQLNEIRINIDNLKSSDANTFSSECFNYNILLIHSTTKRHWKKKYDKTQYNYSHYRHVPNIAVRLYEKCAAKYYIHRCNSYIHKHIAPKPNTLFHIDTNSFRVVIEIISILTIGIIP